MHELKRMFLWALVLTFFGGLGTGAWIGTLTAGVPEQPRSLDSRVEEFQKRFDLDPTRVRLLREILAEHDLRIRGIRQQITKEQFRRKLQQEELSRNRIRDIMTKEQRLEYDKLLGRG